MLLFAVEPARGSKEARKQSASSNCFTVRRHIDTQHKKEVAAVAHTQWLTDGVHLACVNTILVHTYVHEYACCESV